MGYLFQFLNVSFHPPGRDMTRGKEEIKKFIENLFMRLFAIKFHQYFNRGEERHILCYDKRTRRKVAKVGIRPKEFRYCEICVAAAQCRYV